jgi:radical SAM protein with 4Fe4S-binding SPASM domain
MRQNVDEIWELNKYVESMGAQMRGIGDGMLISPCDDGSKEPLKCRLTDGQLKSFIEKERQYLRSSREKLWPRKKTDNEYLCGAGLMKSNINAYGELSPCVQLRFKKENKILSNSFLGIWRDNREINDFRALRVDDRKECLGCELTSYCTSCPGIALLEEGSLLAKLPEACRQARIRKGVYERIYS